MLNENRLYSISLGVVSLQDCLVGVATALSPAMAGHFKFLLHHFFVRLGLIAAHPEPSRRTRPQRLSGEPRILFETRHSTLVTPSNKSARIDQEHGREARALEQFENRICAVEEPGDPVSNSHARHDQMDITIDRVTTYRLL